MIPKRLLLLLFSVICIINTAFADPHPETAAGIFDSLFPRRELNTSLLGVNAFVNDSRFGSIQSQLLEVKNTLGLKYIRILINWDDNVQPTPTSLPNFAFYDEIIKNIPSGVSAVAVVTGLPSWMSDSTNWIAGDPRSTFVKRWLTKVAKRYAKKSKLKAIQVWKEPNDDGNNENIILDLSASPANYVSMLRQARPLIRKYGKKKVVNAATTSIAQNYPDSLNYNKDLKAAGIESLVDYFAIHFYGSSYERLYLPGGIVDFLEKIKKPIWVTESGKQGVLEQLEYAEKTWPQLKELIPRINKIFIYQFTDSQAAEDSWGLRTLDSQFPISDLYLWLRDHN